MPRRETELKNWLAADCALADFELVPASGDASFRRYFRVRLPDGGTLIAMDAPPDKEDCRPFVEVTGRLERAGVHVPHIHAQGLAQGFLLLEDLGDRLYLGELNADTADRLYGDAIDALLRVQHSDGRGLPLYDRELLWREMSLFPEWLLERHLGLALSSAERRVLEQTFENLAESALAQPRVPVHRDYHSRNLLVCDRATPGVIDYQDAVIGPLTYDLVSLLRDCYIRWPQSRVEEWLEGYTERALDAGLLAADDRTKVRRWFDLMGAQRHLKAAGIFARLWHRDGKPGYLDDIPRTLGYILEVAESNPSLQSLAALIGERVLPRLEAA